MDGEKGEKRDSESGGKTQKREREEDRMKNARRYFLLFLHINFRNMYMNSNRFAPLQFLGENFSKMGIVK